MADHGARPPGTVLVVGSANVDLTASVSALPRPGETVLAQSFVRRCGGKGANQAAAAGRLGARVGLVAATGDDDVGEAVREAARNAGVRLDHLHRLPASPTGMALITVDDAGENVIVVSPGANTQLSPEHAAKAIAGLGPTDVILVSLEITTATAAAALLAARSQGATSVLNPSPYTEDVEQLLSSVDVLIMNDGEAERLGNRRLDGLDLSVVITLGGEGARVRARPSVDNSWVAVRAPAVEVVDTTGCGDAFAGAVAAELAMGADLVSATRFAVRYAAVAATMPGAQSSYVDRAAVEDTLQDSMKEQT
ncbi:MAG TPA: ribokinase [Microlunatus sp.]